MSAIRRLDAVVAAIEQAIIVVGLSAMVIAYFVAVVLRYSVTVGWPLLVGGVVLVLVGLILFPRATVERMGTVLGLVFGGLLAAVLGLLCVTEVQVPWTDEVCRFLLLWVGFAGASLATRYAGHLSIDVADKALKGAARHVVAGVAMLIASGFCGIATVVSTRYVLQKLEHGAQLVVTGVPEWIPLVVLPLAFAVMCLRFVGLAFARFRGEEVKHDEAAEAIEVAERMETS